MARPKMMPGPVPDLEILESVEFSILLGALIIIGLIIIALIIIADLTGWRSRVQKLLAPHYLVDYALWRLPSRDCWPAQLASSPNRAYPFVHQ